MNTVEAYIASFPDTTKDILNRIRKLIKAAAPAAEEKMAYGLPAYKTNGKPLVYFGAFKKHIGFYATPTGHKQFEKALSKYKQGKGSVQFPFNEPIPYDLIEKIVKFRLKENREK